MDAQLILDNLRTVAETPGGVERLRALIIDLAVRGRLSTRSEGDAAFDAPDLRIEAADGRPSDVPSTWSWTRLESLGPPGERTTADGPFGSKLKTSHYVDQPGYRVIRLGNIGWGVFKEADQSFVDGEHFRSLRTYHLRSGDIVVASLGNPCGRAAIVPDSALPALHKADCFRVRLHPSINKRFVLFVLNSQMTLARAAELNRGDTRGRINLSHLNGTCVPVPPRAEQDRIVAKVDELMQLCNDLEARQQARHMVTARLRASALAALTKADTDDDLQTAWTRIHANWGALTNHPDSIDALRRTILQLAVAGRLAENDSAEASAAELLEGIESGSSARAVVERSWIPYSIPANWRWVHLQDVCSHIVDCLHKTPRYVEDGYRVIRTSDVEPGRILLGKARHVDQQTFEERTSRLRPVAGDVVYSREGGRFGIAAVVPPDIDLCLGQRMMQFRCADGVEPEYLSWFLNSPLGFGQARADIGGSASPHVNIKAIRRFLLPLPPTAEQHRVVGRVRELMGQCDQLEARLDVRDRAGALLSSSLASAVAS